jgi:hypothetical protein
MTKIVKTDRLPQKISPLMPATNTIGVGEKEHKILSSSKGKMGTIININNI